MEKLKPDMIKYYDTQINMWVLKEYYHGKGYVEITRCFTKSELEGYIIWMSETKEEDSEFTLKLISP